MPGFGKRLADSTTLGYTYNEKIHIAKRFLLPKQIKANGLTDSHLTLTEPALRQIATRYTREAGVRSLERAIGSVVRFKAVEWADHGEGDHELYQPIVEEKDVEKILGIPRWDGDERERDEKRGIVYGLVVMGQGEGGILPVETIAIPGTGQLKLTGSLGDVSDDDEFSCSKLMSLAGHQRKWRVGAELGKDTCVCASYHKHHGTRSPEGS